ncbi:acyltransferase [Phenylobacterium sp. LjRoot164]|uniref:acyltransferase family protein n=1 Tax=unclassified Phenylobacterium TaxID=2640670 RepID=UPI003ECE0C9F
MRPDLLLTLNALRGLAAICVVLYHRAEWFGPNFAFPHAYLAVDFFFILSGFVVARAYGRKLGDAMSVPDFAVIRLQRLYPLIFASVCLAVVVAIAKAATTDGDLPPNFAASVVAGLLVVPVVWDTQSWPLNSPMWTLFLELCANLAFAVMAPRLRGWRLAALVAALGAIFLVFQGAIYAGAPDTRDAIAWGFPRVAFFFFLGALLERVHAPWLRIGPMLGSALMLASFAIPKDAEIARLLTVLVLYPALVLGGANREPATRLGALWADVSGRISYPLYILHIPLLGMLAGASLAVGLPQQPASIPEAVVRVVLVAAASWAALKLFDEPLQAHFKRRRLIARRV